MILSSLLLTALMSPAHAEDTPAEEAEAPAAEEPSGPISYTLAPDSSWLYVVVYNDLSAMASRMGHDHAIRATSFQGKVSWDPEDASACEVEITVPVTSLRPDPPGMRAHEGLAESGAVGESSLETIMKNFQGKSQLYMSSFPSITYTATSCEGSGSQVSVKGQLSIRGSSTSVTVPMTVSASPDSFSAKGTLEIRATDFGFKPFSALGGALRNQDKMKLVIDLKGS